MKYKDLAVGSVIYASQTSLNEAHGIANQFLEVIEDEVALLVQGEANDVVRLDHYPVDEEGNLLGMLWATPDQLAAFWKEQAMNAREELTRFDPAVRQPVLSTSYQNRAWAWMQETFAGLPENGGGLNERIARFGEEAIELVQAVGVSEEDFAELVHYVYNRPKGDPMQEVAGSAFTLALVAQVLGIDMMEEAEIELERVSSPAIRAKVRKRRESKPDVMSLLPGDAK